MAETKEEKAIKWDVGHGDWRVAVREQEAAFASQPTRTYVVYDPKEMSVISRFSIAQFPNCRHACLFLGVVVNENYREKGLGKTFHQLRLRIARELGYQRAYCTVASGNRAQVRIMEKYEWKCLTNMPADGEYIGLWQRVLT